MAKDVIVVEMKAVAQVRNYADRFVTVGPGEVAIERELIAANLAASRRITALDREPREEEIQLSAERHLIHGDGDAAAGPSDDSDDRSLTQLLKADLLSGAALLGLDESGTKADLVARIEAEAERRGVSTEGPGLQVIERIYAADGDEA